MPSYRRRSQLVAALAAAYLSLFGLLPRSAGAELPSVASINLCTDQLVISVADPAQIRSLSWLSADPEESMLWRRAADHPLNYGSAEELMTIGADVVIAGSQTSPFTRSLLRRLGSTIVEIESASSLADVERNLRVVGEAVGRGAQAEAAIVDMRRRADAIRARRDARARSAVVVRAGGFTVGRDTLANELLALAGLDNVVAGLDRWGSLSIETLLATNPEVIVLTRYRDSEASLANSFFAHPGLASLDDAIRLEVPASYFACGAPASVAAAAMLLEQLAAP